MDPKHVIIVWAPMMPGDDYAAARKATANFGNRATQFWDPNKEVGREYRTAVFSDAYEKMYASLPPDHPLREDMPRLKERYTTRPEWDIYMFFAPGVEWGATPPPPTRFVRHLGRIIEKEGERLSLMWVDDYASPPVEGNLSDEIGRLADDILGDTIPSTK